jgi:hypothetical protein
LARSSIFDAHRKFGPESRYITMQRDLNKAHLWQWADGVGIDDAATATKQRTVHSSNLDDLASSCLCTARYCA